MSTVSNESPFDVPNDYVADRRLVLEYMRTGMTVDALAYSEEFEQMYSRLQAKGELRSKGDVFRRLLALRKTGRLPKLVFPPNEDEGGQFELPGFM